MANTKKNSTRIHRGVNSSGSEITLYDLMIYRDFMTPLQLERYGDYFLYKKPPKPFTPGELAQLKQRKEYHTLRRQAENARIECELTKSRIQKSVNETWELLIRSQLQQWGNRRLTA